MLRMICAPITVQSAYLRVASVRWTATKSLTDLLYASQASLRVRSLSSSAPLPAIDGSFDFSFHQEANFAISNWVTLNVLMRTLYGRASLYICLILTYYETVLPFSLPCPGHSCLYHLPGLSVPLSVLTSNVCSLQLSKVQCLSRRKDPQWRLFVWAGNVYATFTAATYYHVMCSIWRQSHILTASTIYLQFLKWTLSVASGSQTQVNAVSLCLFSASLWQCQWALQI